MDRYIDRGVYFTFTPPPPLSNYQLSSCACMGVCDSRVSRQRGVRDGPRPRAGVSRAGACHAPCLPAHTTMRPHALFRQITALGFTAANMAQARGHDHVLALLTEGKVEVSK